MASNPLLSYTILVVDDEPTNTKVLDKILSKAGYTSVVTTNDSRETLALVERHRPGVVLLDLNMPHIDGFGVLRQLKSQLEDSCPPVVFLTAQGDQSSRLQALQGGARDFLTKPFDRAELLVRIENMLALRQGEEERLRFYSQYDNLTGLPNRDYSIRLLDDNLANRQDEPVAVLLLALQRFDRINQSLGHEAGDRLLCAFKDRILKMFPQRQTIIGRIEGARFLIVMLGLEAAHFSNLADRLQHLLDDLHLPMQIDDVEFRPTAHIGASLFPKDGRNARELLASADTALTRARSQTDLAYAFADAATDAQVREQIQLETELHRALEREEFFLVFQPQVALTDGRIVGLEALLRWNHPTRGVVPPGQFIPLLEETGLIIPAGEWIIDQACAQARVWLDTLPGQSALRIAINLSPRQFQSNNLLEQVKNAIKRYHIPPHQLELEVTESLLIEDFPGTHQLLSQLDTMGVRIALDDFGTGYSALTYLQAFPFHAMKVDRSFVSTVGGSRKSEALLRAIVQIGKSLELEVVAEGIETKPQFDFLRNHGCDLAQGFGLAKPQPPAEIEALLKNGYIKTLLS
ncbi:putative bifunctional diguanylate cyclase/phosphodiesterase [Thiorhodovibrio frisius]|uniref:cyclic-guanylate-specific phosphodiesterase n=1 Tax=Thiorhodovibrio frisius TaxID=631362 RepID=H8YYM0_9GAMM|nr:EAL domain-containing protein [Thiorhodovibrio frisius]EIC23546.1 diguanylate cyclase (GGDEF) domain-containing protein [Thiorhodovibrio frisius]WPL23367.1 Bacteriophytochrome cph2 [Thiorhodovibrio frisius]